MSQSCQAQTVLGSKELHPRRVSQSGKYADYRLIDLTVKRRTAGHSGTVFRPDTTHAAITLHLQHNRFYIS